MFTKSAFTLLTQRSFWQFAVFPKVLDQDLHFKWISVTSQSPFARSGFPKSAITTGSSAHFVGHFLDKEEPISPQERGAASFWLQHRDQHLILQIICHFEPFWKFELSKKISCGPPFAKMPKMTDFSCLQNLLLRSVRCVVFGNLPLFLNYLIGTLILNKFQWCDSRLWPAEAFQKVH